jgi:hypothetical protein
MNFFMTRALVLMVVMILGGAGPVLAEWTYDEGLKFEDSAGLFELMINNRAQVRAIGTNPDLGSRTQSFDIHQYKITLTGVIHKDWAFRFQANLAAGSEQNEELLEDAFFVFRKNPYAQLWMGQGKVFFGRQSLTSTGRFQHNPRDRSAGRDVGVALIGENRRKTYSYQVGVYNGNGINLDEKDNKQYMATARLVVTPFGAYDLEETDLDRPDESRLAVGVSVMTLTRGTVGVPEDTRETVSGIEFAYKIHGLNMTGEFFSRSERPPLAAPLEENDIDGWYFQIGYLFKSRNEMAARYSKVLPDLPPRSDTSEIGVAWNYYFKDHDYKLQSDLRALRFEADPLLDGCGTECDDTYELRVQMQIGF